MTKVTAANLLDPITINRLVEHRKQNTTLSNNTDLYRTCFSSLHSNLYGGSGSLSAKRNTQLVLFLKTILNSTFNLEVFIEPTEKVEAKNVVTEPF